MKQPKLSQSCLLDVSGELGPEASGILREHVETYPSAMFEYDLALSQYKQLRSLPGIESQMDQLSMQRMKQEVKDRVHGAVDQQRIAARRRMFRRVFYRSMSIASGVAAALVVMVGVYIVRQHIQAQQVRIRDAESTFQEMAESRFPYRAGTPIREIRARIDHFGTDNIFDAQTGAGSAGIMRLFNALDKIPVPGVEDGLPQTGNIQ